MHTCHLDVTVIHDCLMDLVCRVPSLGLSHGLPSECRLQLETVFMDVDNRICTSHSLSSGIDYAVNALCRRYTPVPIFCTTPQIRRATKS